MYKKELLHIENCDKEEREIIEEYGKTGMLFIDTVNNYKMLIPIGIENDQFTETHITIFFFDEIWCYIDHFNEKHCSYLEREKERELYKHFQKDILMIMKVLYGL